MKKKNIIIIAVIAVVIFAVIFKCFFEHSSVGTSKCGSAYDCSPIKNSKGYESCKVCNEDLVYEDGEYICKNESTIKCKR